MDITPLVNGLTSLATAIATLKTDSAAKDKTIADLQAQAAGAISPADAAILQAKITALLAASGSPQGGPVG